MEQVVTKSPGVGKVDERKVVVMARAEMVKMEVVMLMAMVALVMYQM